MNRNGNKALEHFCAIPVAIVISIYLFSLCKDNFYVFPLYDDEINLPTSSSSESKKIQKIPP